VKNENYVCIKITKFDRKHYNPQNTIQAEPQQSQDYYHAVKCTIHRLNL